MKQRKRGQGEGSIYQMSDGRWAAAVSIGWKLDASGKPVWRRKVYTAKTRLAVSEKLKTALRDQQRGINISPDRWTVAQYLADWVASVKASVSPSTYVAYESVCRLHLIPALGDIQLTKLAPHHVEKLKQQLLAQVRKKGRGIKKVVAGALPSPPQHLSAATVYHVLLILRVALTRAVKLDLTPRNVALLVSLPKAERPEIQPFDPEEAQRFLEAAKSHRLGCLFSAALGLGMRKGEALGLRWEDIDLERATVSIRGTLQRIKIGSDSQLLRKEPKRASRRTLNLPSVVLSELVLHRQRQEQERIVAGSGWQNTQLVFTTRRGTPVEPGSLQDAFAEILTAAKLRRVRIHDLRHTAATLLLVRGVHPRTVMELLGHTRVSTTLDTYSHVVPALRKEAAEEMDRALTPAVAIPVANSAPPVRPN